MRSGQVRAAGFVLCFSFWGLLVAYVAESGGVTSPAFGLFDIVIIVTAILLGVRGAVGFGLLCIASAVVLYWAGTNGWLHSIEQAPTPARAFATHTTLFIVLTLLMAISGRSVWGALMRARSGEQRLAERKQAEEALQRALEQQKELVDLKSRFISMASHDFRTPLSVILTTLSLLEMQISDQSAAGQLELLQKRFRRIDESVQQMTKLLDDVLAVNRADTGKVEIHPERLDVETFCKAIVQEIREFASGQHELTFTVTGEATRFEADKQLLRQILVNLLSNAVKYSPQGGEVLLDVRCGSETMEFRVQDEGIGIPEPDRERLFETFHRAHNVGDIPGTGLGMAIVKRAVDALGGTIVFESQVGVGTTFTVRLPMTLRTDSRWTRSGADPQ